MGTLYYGDNLDILTRYIADASVDLVYLRGGGRDKWGTEDGRADPPFNSAQNYNAPFVLTSAALTPLATR
jgi:hypothetical protein